MIFSLLNIIYLLENLNRPFYVIFIQIMFNLLLVMVLLPSFAAADESINIIGTWQGVTNAAVMGVDKHYTTINAENIRFVNVKMLTLSMDKLELYHRGLVLGLLR